MRLTNQVALQQFDGREILRTSSQCSCGVIEELKAVKTQCLCQSVPENGENPLCQNLPENSATPSCDASGNRTLPGKV